MTERRLQYRAGFRLDDATAARLAAYVGQGSRARSRFIREAIARRLEELEREASER